MWKFIKQPSTSLATLLIITNLIQSSLSQTTCNNGQGRVLYERLPNQQLQGFDDDVIRDTAPPFRVLEKCQDLCLRDRTASNNLVRACTSFDFQPGSRIASYNGNTEYEESTCYLTREQAVPEGIGNLMLVPNSVHFTEICLTCEWEIVIYCERKVKWICPPTQLRDQSENVQVVATSSSVIRGRS